MLTRKQMLALFEQLNTALGERGATGEIGLVGGAVMCLVYNARQATKDVDAIFEPASVIREAATEIAEANHLPPNWLNDAAKGYLVPGFIRENVLALSNLRIWSPDTRYMLAMKCISARWDSSDRDDVEFLIKQLKLTTPHRVFEIIESYYPSDRIPPKTRFFIDELISEK